MEEEAAAKAAAAKDALNKKNSELRKKLQNVKSRLFATTAIQNAPRDAAAKTWQKAAAKTTAAAAPLIAKPSPLAAKPSSKK
jgi:hypothetical protein